MRLGLRIAHPGAAWLAATGTFAIYLLTMARDLTFYDSPELALVAHQLGVGHPIGQPLHTLLGCAFAHIPYVSVHIGLTMMSALFGAMCALPAWSLAERLGGSSANTIWIRALVTVGVGASLICWEPSSRVEVYTLAAFAALWGIAWSADHPGFTAGLAVGLAACAHAVIGVAAGIAIVPRLLVQGPASPDADPGPTRRCLLFTAGSTLGLLLYAYVPIAASDRTRFAWGAPRDAASFLAYVRGADYAHNQGITAVDLVDHLGRLVLWGLENGSLIVGIVGGIAFFVLGRKRALLGYAMPLSALVLIGFVCANVVFHPDVPDYRGYLLVPFWLAGAGVAAAAQRVAIRGGRAIVFAAALAALPSLALLGANEHLRQPRDDPSLARIIAEGALVEAPRRAILIVEADHWVAPLLYLQEVEHLRADVTVIAVGLASSRWFWDYISARHEDLRAFELVGPGGRLARMQRFLAANGDRPVLFESERLAVESGRSPCAVGFLVWTATPPGVAPAPCGEPDAAAASAAIDAARPLRGESFEVAARVGEARGVVLWRLGRGRDALGALLAGLDRPEPTLEGLAVSTPPLAGPLPTWSRPAALHDPARNYLLAGLLLHSAGRRDAALRFVDLAISRGLDGAAIARRQIVGH